MHRFPIAVCIALIAGNAAAQVRTFVSIAGLDSNPCTNTSPCRSFTAAVTAVAAGGDVVVLDSGGYGPVMITKPVSIVAPLGIYAGVTVTGGSGIVDSHGDGVVVLRGLSITGLGGTNAIEMDYAQNLHLDHIDVKSFRNGSAVLMQSGYTDHTPQLVIRDSLFREVGYGANVQSTVSGQDVSADHVRFDMAYGAGIQMANNSTAFVSNCVFHDGNYGVYMSPSAGQSTAIIDQSNFTLIGYGVLMLSTGTGSSYARVGRSTFVGLTAAASRTGSGLLVSFGNNQVDSNYYTTTWDSTVPTQ
jgi:hypothetical protein